MALRLCLFGASDDTGNLGVGALLRGVLAGIEESAPGSEVVVFDHGTGAGREQVRLGERVVRYRRVGAPYTKRVHRPESFARLAAASRVGTRHHPGAEALRHADAVLVIAGGDSFADLYGDRRWQAVTAPMRLALRLRRPLVLLPQTYGPFRSPSALRSSAELVHRADMSWARDRPGHEALVALAARRHDPARHRLGVDVAFAVPPATEAEVDRWYGVCAAGDGEQIAVNVSGLLASGGGGPHGPHLARASEYRTAVAGLVRHVLRADRSARVVLVPHVLGSAAESDLTACRELAAELGPRVLAAPPVADPAIVKGLIARSTWFCGARMHATIAALSTGVPAAAIAYSDKFAGTFAEVGRSDAVADARHSDADELVRTLVTSYERRHEDRDALRGPSLHARQRAKAQFDDILAVAGAG
jgi:colanic acid/amylovoran biosynthesis protein